ncbi:MAG: hypothetical protein ABSH16_14825 [Sedimentisphaerales bacterium]
MLQRDSFKLRLEKGIDVYTHEFIYPLMQGYDSVVVKSDVELGGTDQTFKIILSAGTYKRHTISSSRSSSPSRFSSAWTAKRK